VRQGSALRTTCRARVERRRTTRQATMEFSYVYILQIALKPLASRSHQKTLRRPDLSATKAVLPFSEMPLAISPNRNTTSVAD